jgi:pyridoxal 5'-phosphate synthase pdxS subunit
MMKLGMDGVFVGSGIFKSPDQIKMARSIVEAVENFEDYRLIGTVSTGLQAMEGISMDTMAKEERLQERGL